MDLRENFKKASSTSNEQKSNCDHNFVVETNNGSKTGDYVCSKCGAAIWYTDYEKFCDTGELPSHLSK